MADKKIVRVRLTIGPGVDATPEMQLWFFNNRARLAEAAGERIHPKVEELINLELRHLGYFKEFGEVELIK